MADEYTGRTVYSLDGFTRGKIVSVARTLGGEIVHANIDLDEPDEGGETRVQWAWKDCKLA